MKSFTKVLTIVFLIIIGFCTQSLAIEHGGQLYYSNTDKKVRLIVRVITVGPTGTPGEILQYSGKMYESKDDTFGTVIIDKYIKNEGGIADLMELRTETNVLRILNPGTYNVVFRNVDGVVVYQCKASENGGWLDMVVKKAPVWSKLIPDGEDNSK